MRRTWVWSFGYLVLAGVMACGSTDTGGPAGAVGTGGSPSPDGGLDGGMDAGMQDGGGAGSAAGAGGGGGGSGGMDGSVDANTDAGADAGTGIIGDGPDSDGDGISDSAETDYGTDPDDADSDGDGVSDGDEVSNGSDPNDADSDDDGFTDGEEEVLGTDPDTGGDEGCAAYEAAASETTRPVDVIVIVDNSGSMDGEIAAIQDRINEDFGDILDAAGVDWRVILLSRHGTIDHNITSCDDNGICIEGDLAGTASCDPYAPPAETNRFKHYSVCIDSEDGLAKAAASFDQSPPAWAPSFQTNAYFDSNEDPVELDNAPTGWHAWLRPDAVRTFLMISDDESAHPHTDFTDWMYAKDPSFFGTPSEPNWVFHSIIAIEAKPTPTDPWLPDEPAVTNDCGPGSAEIGYDYQDLSIASGGLRFPICENGNFDAVFQAIAQSVVDSSAVPCTLVPEPVSGAGDPDFERTVVVYEAGDSSRTTLSRVEDGSECAGGDYYLDADNQIELCSAMCSTVEADTAALVRLRVACAPVCGNGELEDGEECDDGNTDAGDTCSPTCTIANLCGNGTVDSGEECDDGNVASGDGCSTGCQTEMGCGNGTVDSGEECDDDNLVSGDGCSASCQLEQGCGDGVVQAGEQCDDDNLEPGDGCDENCMVEVT